MATDDLNELCNVRLIATDLTTGEVVSDQMGHNVWTNTGREYSCLLKSYKTQNVPFRSDRILYVGLGTGNQPESVGVTRLSSPVAWEGTKFLKMINLGLTSFQTSDGAKTSIRYTCRFDESDLVVDGAPINITECGLFTDGHQDSHEVGQREEGIARATLQSPVAYHTFDPIPKTSNIQLDLIWELRH
tara:strand:+ start:118 stop:681 length:564 start_codon:yes stop_codon:yes gene_type:complete